MHVSLISCSFIGELRCNEQSRVQLRASDNVDIITGRYGYGFVQLACVLYQNQFTAVRLPLLSPDGAKQLRSFIEP